MSEDLKAQFEAASKEAKSLPARPNNEDMLELYALYKQGSAGDCTGERPGLLDFVGGAKFDAWTRLDGTSKEDAMARYVKKVESLKGN